MPCAFVRFAREEDAIGAIRNMDGFEIRGNSIIVKEAVYKRGRARLGPYFVPRCTRYSAQGVSQNSNIIVAPRSFKDVVIRGNPFVESNKGEPEEKEKNRKAKKEVEASVNEQERMETDELDIRGMVWKVVDEFFKSDNMEKIK